MGRHLKVNGKQGEQHSDVYLETEVYLYTYVHTIGLVGHVVSVPRLCLRYKTVASQRRVDGIHDIMSYIQSTNR